MSLLTIINCMDPVLRKKCQHIDNIDGNLVTLTENMIETMYKASGLGLAANQVGVSSDLFVIDVGIEKEKRDPVVIINPTITVSEEEIIGEEGCLSIPGYRGLVRRSVKVRAKGLDRYGKPVRVKAEELLAQALEHEIDHLDGVLYIDHLVDRDKLWKEEPEETYEEEVEEAAVETGYTG